MRRHDRFDNPRDEEPMEPIYFASPEEFRAWLEARHESEKELLVGYHKKGTGKPSMTWPESVDEALCFGWIDGVRRSVDDERYMIRFTPRKARSIWSAVNIKRMGELTELGRVRPAGLKAFEARAPEKSGIYTYENRNAAELDAAAEAQFRANAAAWDFFQSQAPSYRRTAIWWVISAKQEATRQKRLATLIDDSASGRRLAQFVRPG
jgi:uncharacterized protein YdeI (YjbR/CyaY-like superfamily)